MSRSAVGREHETVAHGTEDATTFSGGSAMDAGNSGTMYIGAMATGDGWDGHIYEHRISFAQRSAAWMNLTRKLFVNWATEMTVGDEET